MEGRRVRALLAYGLVPAAVAFVIAIKWFVYDDCYAFDRSDDAHVTFPRLKVARDLMLAGHYPWMDLLDNFGTPIHGDSLTFPFGIQSWTYAFLDGPAAMTLNRALIGAFTVVALTRYFRKWFGLLASVMAALGAFYTSGFYWHLAHHQFQVTQLAFVLALLAQRAWTRQQDAPRALAVFGALVLAQLSVSMNLVAVMVPFLAVHQWFTSEPGRKSRDLVRMLVLMFLAMAFQLFDHIAFFALLGHSVRGSLQYGRDYAAQEILHGVMGLLPPWFLASEPPPQQTFHVYDAIFIGPCIVVSMGVGMVRLARQRRPAFSIALCLGVLPFPIVWLMLTNAESLWWSLPLIRSIDVTRLWWLTGIPAAMTIGAAVEAVQEEGFRGKWGAAFLGLGALFAALRMDLFLLWVGEATLVAFTLATIVALGQWMQPSRQTLWRGAASAVLVLGVAGTILSHVVLQENLQIGSCAGPTGASHWFNPSSSGWFEPRALVVEMKGGGRVAAHHAPPAFSSDQTLGLDGIPGSATKNTMVHGVLAERIRVSGMGWLDDPRVAYHLGPPYDTDLLTRMGVQYAVTPPGDPDLTGTAELSAAGWPVVLEAEGEALHENPAYVGLAYGVRGDELVRLPGVRLEPNAIEVDLTGSGSEGTVVTFTDWPGWHAAIDGRSVSVAATEEGFLFVPGTRDASHVRLWYSPVSLVSLFAVKLFVVAMVLLLFRRSALSAPA